MGLYDRDYMREDEGGYRSSRPSTPWSPTIVLLIVLGAIFLLQVAVGVTSGIPLTYALGLSSSRSAFPLDPLTAHFALSLEGIKSGQVWQLLTFQFLHGGIFHLLFNGMTLFSFGRFLEGELPRGRFLALYLLSGTAGGILQILASWVLRQEAMVVVGASAGIAGLLGAFMLSYPDYRIILFPIPFKIRAWNLLWVVLPLSVIGTVFPFGGVAHAAHLGGLLAGGAFVRWNRKKRSTPPPLFSPDPLKVTKEEASHDDYIASEVDPILDKIAKQGIHSLTERERKILETARSKMDKR